MNKLQAKGNWNIIKGKLKQQWAELTDGDLIEGETDEVIGRIQKRTGETYENVKKAFEKAWNSADEDKD